jgi:hypothetical protein
VSLPYGFSNLATGQVIMTGSAVQLPANNASMVTLSGLKGNAHPIYVGPVGVTAATGLEVEPGVPVELDVANTNMLYAIGTGGDVLSFCALF